jgi:hypothetical protein
MGRNRRTVAVDVIKEQCVLLMLIRDFPNDLVAKP